LWDVDNDGVPDWRDPSQWPQYGMTAFKMFSNAPPGTDAERFLSMAGYNYLTGQYEPFDTIPLDPSDWWIIVQSSGPFDLMPDSCVSIIFAVMFADWHSLFMEADTALALIDRFAEDYYNMHWYLYTGVEEHFEFRILDCGLKILPNPVSNRGTIFLSLTTAQDVSLKLYDIAGRHVETLIKGRFAGGMHAIPFEAARLPQGTYFLVMESSCLRESVAVVFVR
jgi:hypothetical protein